MASHEAKPRSPLLTTEDYWAVWLGLVVIALAMGVFWAGSTIKAFAVTPGSWSDISAIGNDLIENFWAYLVICVGFGAIFSISMVAMGRSLKEFIPGYLIVFLGSLAIFYLASWKVMKTWHLGAPLLALLIGIIIGNIKKMPEWFHTAMRTEYYIKTGIVTNVVVPVDLVVRDSTISV